MARNKSASGFDPDIRLVLDAIRGVVRALRESSRQAEKSVGISGAQLFVLEKLRGERPLSMNEIAARTFTHQSSVSVAVQRLVERGLVRRSASRQDARRVELRLTGRGEALLQRSPGAVQERLLASLGRLPRRTRRSLAQGLRRWSREMEIDQDHPTMFFE